MASHARSSNDGCADRNMFIVGENQYSMYTYAEMTEAESRGPVSTLLYMKYCDTRPRQANQTMQRSKLKYLAHPSTRKSLIIACPRRLMYAHCPSRSVDCSRVCNAVDLIQIDRSLDS